MWYFFKDCKRFALSITSLHDVMHIIVTVIPLKLWRQTAVVPTKQMFSVQYMYSLDWNIDNTKTVFISFRPIPRRNGL